MRRRRPNRSPQSFFVDRDAKLSSLVPDSLEIERGRVTDLQIWSAFDCVSEPGAVATGSRTKPQLEEYRSRYSCRVHLIPSLPLPVSDTYKARQAAALQRSIQVEVVFQLHVRRYNLAVAHRRNEPYRSGCGNCFLGQATAQRLQRANIGHLTGS